MEIRLGLFEKSAFVDAGDSQGDTPCHALRRFIAGYTRRSGADVMGEANRRLFRRYGLGVALGTALLAGVATVGLGGPDRTLSRLLSAAAFAQADTDGSGALDKAELGPRAADILRVLDVNGVPGIQPVEAATRGRMTASG